MSDCCPSASGEPSPVDDDTLARMAKALGHPARVRILRLLIDRGTCVCGSIVDELPLAQSTVSQHLKVLKEAGLVLGTIEGPSVCYCAAPDALAGFSAAVASLTSLPPPASPAFLRKAKR